MSGVRVCRLPVVPPQLITFVLLLGLYKTFVSRVVVVFRVRRRTGVETSYINSLRLRNYESLLLQNQRHVRDVGNYDTEKRAIMNQMILE